MNKGWLVLFVAGVAIAFPAQAGTIAGQVFSDRNRNGVRDTGEGPLANVTVTLTGAEGTVNQSTATGADGSFEFPGLPDGDYIVAVPTASRLRASFPNQSVESAPISDFPFGLPRYAGMARTVANLDLFGQFGASYRHMALGDSIGFGFSVCGSLLGEEGYFVPTTDRLERATATDIEPDKQAIPGHETADLLIPGLGPDFPLLYNDVFHAVDRNTPLVSISIGGNDFLGADGGGDPSVAAALVIARRNIQEILSALQGQIPFADIEINTVYDNLEGANAFQNTWVPIWNQVLRETAWGQTRRVTLAEVYRDYAHEEGGSIVGEPGLVCNDIFGLDGIHPTAVGYDVHEEKLWQAFGGVTLSGGADQLDIELGFQRMVPIGQATAFSAVAGDTLDPEKALGFDNDGALVSSNSAEFRVQGFVPNPPAGVEPQSALVKVKYRTTGAPLDDYYLIEASLDGSFAAPGSTPTAWNTIIPIVGASGNDGSERLAFPDQPGFRVASAPLYTGAPIDGSGAVTMADLSNLSVRVVTVAVGTPDAYSVELDGVLVEIFPVPAAAARSAPQTQPASARSFAELRAAAQSVHAAERRAAAHWLAGDERSAATALLAQLARDDESGVRRIAVRALARRGGAPEILQRALKDDEQAVRFAAAGGLLAQGIPDGVGELIAALDRPQMARRARHALASHPAAMPSLADALGSRSAAVRAGAAWVLGDLGAAAQASVPALSGLLEDSDPAVRLAAADALSRLGDTRAIDALRELSADSRFAIDAARGLRRFADPAALRALHTIATGAAAPSAQRFAARYLALGGPSAAPLLRELLSHDDMKVRRLARSGLARLARSGLARLAENGSASGETTP